MTILSDEFYYQPVQIDTINARVYVDLVAKEGDVNGRGLLVTLTENGLMKDTTGIALNLKWEHTSVGNQGLDNFEAVDLSKGLYKITYPSEMLNRGTVRASIQISDSGKSAGTRNIRITIESGVGDDTVIVSSDSFTALAQALIDVNKLEETYAPELNSVKQQLAQTIAMQTGLLAFKGSDTTANINAKTGMVTGDYWYSTDGLTYLAYTGSAWASVGSSLTELSNVRLGADGVTYATAGESVRSQFERVDINLNKVAVVPIDIIENKTVEWKYANLVSSSKVGVGGSSNRILCIPIEPNNTYIVKKTVQTSKMVMGIVTAATTADVVNDMSLLIREPVSTATIGNNFMQTIVAPTNGTMLLVWLWGSGDAGLDWNTVLNSVSVYKNTDKVQLMVDVTESDLTDKSVSYSKLNDNLKNGITIFCGSTREYKTIKSAVEYAVQFPNSTVYVDAEEFNIIAEFGTDYFTNYTYSTIADGGIVLKNGIHLIFATGSKVKCHYTGDNYNVMYYFSPFMAGPGGFWLENAEIEASRVRYCVHDDLGTSVYTFERTRFTNCKMYIDNNLNTAREQYECIGGGMAIYGEFVIEGCMFESTVMTRTQSATISTGGISYHQNGNAVAQSRMYVRDCVFIGERDRFSCSTLGDSSKISTVIVSNCISKTILPQKGNNGPVDNVRMYSINNLLY